MIVELAIETSTPVEGWWTASDAVLATALDVLERRAASARDAVREASDGG